MGGGASKETRDGGGAVGSFSLGARLVPSVIVDNSNSEHQVLAITGVDPESACGMAGLQVGDLLLELHGRKVNSYGSLTEALSSAKGASAVIAKVRRKSGGEEILTLAPANGNHAGRPVIRGAKGAV